METTTVAVFNNVEKAGEALEEIHKLGVREAHMSETFVITVKSLQAEKVRAILEDHDAREVRDFTLN